MRAAPVLLLPALALLLAGCATQPSPVGDADAAHAGVACPAGTLVGGFNAAGAPQCLPPPAAGFSCPKGEVVVGFDAGGAPRCRSVMDIAEDATGERPAPTPPTPARSISLTSNGAITSSGTKNYTIAAASTGMRWNDLKYTLDGAELAYDGGTADGLASFGSGDFYVVEGGARTLGKSVPTSAIDAGDSFVLMHSSLSGKTLRILDAQSNSVVLTLTVG